MKTVKNVRKNSGFPENKSREHMFFFYDVVLYFLYEFYIRVNPEIFDDILVCFCVEFDIYYMAPNVGHIIKVFNKK